MGSSVIVADNHPLFRVALGTLLREQHGLEVVAEAAEGRQALELCRRFKPDLVVMAVRMPEVNGLEASRVIKREFPDTGVLLLSDYDTSGLVGEALEAGAFEAGACGYILKTATPQQIIGAIREALEVASPVNRKLGDMQLPPGEYSLKLDSDMFSLRGASGHEVGKVGIFSLRQASKDAIEKGAWESVSEERATPYVTVLTPRQRQVVELVSEGLTNAQIGERLYLRESTVKQHLRAAYKRLRVSNRTEAANRIRP